MTKGKAAQAAALSAAGIFGSMLWQQKDMLKAVMQLRKYPDGWVQVHHAPEVFLTKASEKSRKNLFEHIQDGGWRLVDRVADGYFWINGREEVLLLTQRKVMNDYWRWTASRPVFKEAERNEAAAAGDDGAQEWETADHKE